MLRITHLITNLGQGGAQGVLFELINALPYGSYKHTVVSLCEEGIYALQLRERGVAVHTLEMPRGRLTVSGLSKLYRLMRASQPDMVQTWMYHADLIGGVIARAAGCRPVVWGVHHSNLALSKNSFSTLVVACACAVHSRWVPVAIACVSKRAVTVHRALGYAAKKFVVIPNGYRLTHFAPNIKARERLRRDWRVSPHETLLGLVGRWHPQKDHANLLQALALVAQHFPGVRCALIGPGMEWENAELTGLIRQQGVEARVLLAGPRNDIPEVMNALDLHVLSSAGEAFPNVVAEAMACGTPCVVTDVGDAALIVGDTGWIAPPQNPGMLAQAIQKALTVIAEQDREELSRRCRARIEENFSLERMVSAYDELWRRVISDT